MRTCSLIVVATVIAAMLPTPAQAEPHTGIALRAWARHHLNILFVPESDHCGEASPDVWEWPQNYGSQGLVTAVVIGDTRVTLEYDGRGRLVRYDYPGYAAATCTYDEVGNLILITRQYWLDGERLGVVYRATYNAHKQPIQESYKYDWTHFRNFVSSSYDLQGRLVLKRYQADFDFDGTIDSIGDYRIAYDAQGRPTSEIDERDDDADGVIESRDAFFRTWGKQDQVVATRWEYDANGDGIVDTWSSTVSTFDHQGNAIEQVYSLDYAGRSGGGADGTPESTYLRRSTYDARGNVILTLADGYNTNSEFALDWRTEDSYEYDAAGRLTRQESSSDADLDGVFEDVLIVTIAYDERGRFVEWGTEWEGDPTSAERERYVFDARGYLTSVIREYFDGTEWIGGAWMAFEYL